MKAISEMPMDQVENGQFIGDVTTVLLHTDFKNTFAYTQGLDDNQAIEDDDDHDSDEDSEGDEEDDGAEALEGAAFDATTEGLIGKST